MKKHLLLILIITIVIWLVPSFTPKAQAVDIEEGDLIRAIGDFDVWIVKYVGFKKFKRLILNPDVFNMYGHLRWEDIKDIDRAIVKSFTESTLVRAEGDPKVYKLYPAGDTGQKRWIPTAEVFLAWDYDWDSVYTINDFDRDAYITGEPLSFAWVSPTGHNDPSDKWGGEALAYDDNLETYAYTEELVTYLELTHSAVDCGKVRFIIDSAYYDTYIRLDLDVYYGEEWHPVLTKMDYDPAEYNSWIEQMLGGVYNVVGARIRARGGGWTEEAMSGHKLRLKEFNFGE